MQGKIAIEEHFAREETLGSSQGPHGETDGWKALRRNLLDVQDERIARMDRLGIDMAVLSLNAPVLQAMPDRKQAAELAVRANDLLAEQVATIVPAPRTPILRVMLAPYGFDLEATVYETDSVSSRTAAPARP